MQAWRSLGARIFDPQLWYQYEYAAILQDQVYGFLKPVFHPETICHIATTLGIESLGYIVSAMA